MAVEYNFLIDHSHTVQVAICSYSFLCTLVSTLVHQQKCHQCKLQCVMTTMSVSGAFALVDEMKNTCARFVSLLLTWKSSQSCQQHRCFLMQCLSPYSLQINVSTVTLCNFYIVYWGVYLVCKRRKYKSSTYCNLRWWCFSFQQLAQILHLHMWWSSPIATCAGGVFSSNHWRKYSTCTRATCTVWWWLHVVVVYICGGGECSCV